MLVCHSNRSKKVDATVQWSGVLGATLVSIVVGVVWYLPKTFGATWYRRSTPKSRKKQLPRLLMLLAISSFFMAYILAHTAFLANRFFGNGFLQDALTTSFWLWLGMQALRNIARDRLTGVVPRLSLIHAGHDAVSLLLSGLVIGIVGIY